MEDLPTQGLGREELPSCSRLMAGTPRQAPLDEEVGQVGTNLLWTSAIRRALGALGSAGDSGHRGLLRCGASRAMACRGSSWHVAGSEERLRLSGCTDLDAPSVRHDGATIRHGLVRLNMRVVSSKFQQPS